MINGDDGGLGLWGNYGREFIVMTFQCVEASHTQHVSCDNGVERLICAFSYEL